MRLPRIGCRTLQWLVAVWLCCAITPAFALANQLAGHASPYLALHGEDPVAWQQWTPATVARARRENKLIFLSIGYFSCHWCHVMQRESYKHAVIAKFLNRHFIPVKIDRELEPALDARMIAFAEATRGMGGWPLNVFVTPDGHPLYAILYAPPEEFFAVLQRLQALWTAQDERLKQLARGAAVTSQGPGKPRLDAAVVQTYSAKIVRDALVLADSFHGGFGEESKFPSVPQLEFLLSHLTSAENRELEKFLLLTLDQMAANALQDHLGGGFFRYTVDPSWETPHFEKMLYDNALLARLYLRAWRQFGKPGHKAIAMRTLDFMASHMRGDPATAFIAALSAVDARDVEGGYYLWSKGELKKLLTPEAFRAIVLAWGFTEPPPFEHGYLPIPTMSAVEVAQEMKLTVAQAQSLLAGAEAKLRQARGKRGLPRDTKVIAGWNGLALAAFAEAARLTGEKRYRQTAGGLRDYLMRALWDGQALHRSVAGGKPAGRVSLEDYAYVADGLLAWATLTGKRADYAVAGRVVDQAWRRFYGRDGWRLAEHSLIEAEAPQDLLADGPMPAPSAVLAAVSLRLAAVTNDRKLRDRALAALNSGHERLAAEAFWYATHVAAMTLALRTH